MSKWVHKDDVKADDTLVADGGFSCIAEGARLVVEEDKDGLFVSCSSGSHYLVGQLDEGDHYIGLTKE